MKERRVKAEEIKIVEMGLVNRCNLKCPLCLYSKKKIEARSHQFVDIQELICFFEKLPNFETAILEGNYSEPTLYPHLLELVAYLKSRSIRIRLCSNGSTKNTEFWKKLGESLDTEDIVRFAIDGSTQELHSKYRIGGDLKKVLNNHRAFKGNSKAVTVLQNIIFEYNVNDRMNIKEIFLNHGFDYLNHIKCYMTDEKRGDQVHRPIEAVERYYRMFNRSFKDVDEMTLICDSYLRKEIYINHAGQVFLCGSLDQAEEYADTPLITDNLEVIFKDVTRAANGIYTNETCLSDCNIFCHSMGEKFPDLLMDRNGNIEEIKYHTRELKGKGPSSE